MKSNTEKAVLVPHLIIISSALQQHDVYELGLTISCQSTRMRTRHDRKALQKGRTTARVSSLIYFIHSIPFPCVICMIISKNYQY